MRYPTTAGWPRPARCFGALFALLLIMGSATVLDSRAGGQSPGPQGGPPNILFIILDDVGIDQLGIFNPLDPDPVSTPNIDVIAQNGVRFTNCWMMPECSPSRSTVFTGRFPLRTGVDAAILSYDLPQAQLSPFEVTTPQVLSGARYQSALIGKYHLGGPDLNPAGFGTPAALGWDFYLGNLQGGPPFIDPTLGNQIADTTMYTCGFPIGDTRGACWFKGPSNQVLCDDNDGAGYTGHECVTLGGIPKLTADGGFAPACTPTAASPDFSGFNGYYAWQQVINDHGKVPVRTARKYMSTVQTDTAIDWILDQSQGQPWMCTVSYDAIHTPYQQPPAHLYPPGFEWPPDVEEDCGKADAQKILGDLMLFAMDSEIGRLMVGIGLASRGPSGELIYDPQDSNTMVVLLGDNGTFVTSVRDPYDPLRAKATPYQTGVLAPLVVAGPLVQVPNRPVHHLVNSVDLFELFGEIAGIDVRSVVPSSHILDSRPVLPYLTNPDHPAIRQYNFTQLGDGVRPPPRLRRGRVS